MAENECLENNFCRCPWMGVGVAAKLALFGEAASEELELLEQSCSSSLLDNTVVSGHK
jgi:hypothetical protein